MYYTPYGEKVTSAITGQDIFHKKYTGQDDDTSASLSAGSYDAGLLYYKARYYDPALGRFITADSIIPGADKTQAYNRYMYVAGNPMKFKDPGGHKWGKGTWGKICSTVAGAAVGATYGGLTGAAIGSAGGPPGAAIGGVIGAVVGGVAGGIAGYKAWNSETAKDTVRNRDWWHEKSDDIHNYWDENKWFRITTYILVTIAVIALSVFIGPEIAVLGFTALNTMLIGALIGASIGFAYGGTNGFKGGWDWENALKHMMRWSCYGAAFGYSVGNFYNFCTNPGNQAFLTGNATEATTLQSGGLSGTIANITALNSSTNVLYIGAPIAYILSGLSVITMPRNTENLLDDHEFTFIPGVSYDLNNI